ncbi:MAG: hypothetical protein IH621_14730 [Krumholzibacteria bacterium]|nr:hypothetical protein [Candidatus Krumholzibacteria bacterium]
MRTAVVTVLVCLLASAPARGASVAALADLRVRQEVLDGVYHFAPDPDRDWIRVRARAGGRLSAGAHALELRLANEHRHHLHPDDLEFAWDELLVDRAAWTWTFGQDDRLTVGRQDIVWPGGFLMLERSPLDGSRTLFQDAVRLQLSDQDGGTDLAFIRNLKRDHHVLAGDDERPLADMDETGLYLRRAQGRLAWALIAKDESDPDGVLADLLTLTVDLRATGELGRTGDWAAEVAVQHLREDRGEGRDDDAGTALALQAFARDAFLGRSRLELGGFYYSGRGDGGWRAFRAPWGRWPKWSELYIYTLIGESTPGRVAVAAWENVAAPRLQLTRPLGGRADGRLGATWLLAPQPSWKPRGLLTQAELTVRLGSGVDGHLLWEMLVPGAFHDGSNGLPPLVDTVHFLRWQLAWSL